MASALSKEMEMMELQLNRFKELAHEALSLHGEAHSLKSVTRYKGFVCEPFPSFFFLPSIEAFNAFVSSHIYLIFVFRFARYY